MASYCDCLYRLADAYKLWCHQEDLWTLAAFRLWDAILTEADRIACALTT